MDKPTGELVLLGESGMMGAAILASQNAGRGLSNFVLPDTRSLLRQILDGDLKEVNDLCRRVTSPQVWIFSAGIIDPRLPEAELMRINVEAPTRLYAGLCRAAADAGATHFVTFGSVLEERAQIVAVNSYIRSKARLLALWQEQAPAGRVPWTHYQLHTLYGGRRLQLSTFLGQIGAALQRNAPFHMSAGYQFREYHHTADVASNVLRHIWTGAPKSSKIPMNSGCATRLRDVATTVFNHFGRPELLKIGSLAPQEGEVFEPSFRRSDHVIDFRDPVDGIIAWLKELGIASAAAKV